MNKQRHYFILTALLIGCILFLCACTGNVTQSEPANKGCAHQYEKWSITKKATCSSEGIQSRMCQLCGFTESQSMPALGHTVVIDPAVKATCLKAGLTEGKHCSECNETIVAQTDIPVTSHQYDGGKVTEDATCQVAGKKTFTCTVCADIREETIPRNAHSYDEGVVAIQATCAQAGQRIYTCTQCGNTKEETIPQQQHTYDQGAITIQATCMQAGQRIYTCTQCSNTKEETIPQQQHTYDQGVITTPATCKQRGTQTFTCTMCNTEKYTITIPMRPHAYDDGTITAQPTCEASGVKLYQCTECETTKTESLPKLGHIPDEKYICTRCGARCPVELDMTQAEKNEANKVEYISSRQVWHQDDNDRYVFVFSLLDKNKAELKAPVVVEIYIKNDDGEIVYSAVKIIRSSDYCIWNYNDGTSKTQATIYINDNEIEAGNVRTGDLYYTVYNPGYVSFDEFSLRISSLPYKTPSFAAEETWKQDGEWEFSVVSATEHMHCSSYLTNYSGFSNEQIVMLTFRYKNIGYGSSFKPDITSITVIDETGEMARLYSTGTSYLNGCDHAVEPTACGNGIVARMSLPYALNNESKTLSIIVSMKDSKGNLREAKFTTAITPKPEEPEEDKLNGCTIKVGTSLPKTISYYTYSGTIQSSCSVTGISFEVSGDDLYIYFTGRKTYDSRGSGQSDSCKIGWKLYDDNNNVIASGTAYTLSLATGEGFVDCKDTAYNCIKPGGTYRLVILNVN